jgi:fatty-acid peroxygenase
VQTLDGEAHGQRKKMFLSLMDDASIQRLSDRFAAQWERAARGWAGQREIVLYDALHPMLARAVCGWAGVPLAESEVLKRSRQLRAMFDYAGAKGPKHIGARLARRQAEQWVSRLVSDIRGDRLHVAEGSPLQVIARFQGPAGVLDPRTAAVEVLNLLRPTVAVSVYIVFIAHALACYPEARPEIPDGDMRFVQEVRRFYPFFPSVMALARRDFEWNGYLFPKGRQVVLDLYGTSCDPRNWSDPEQFEPDRFRKARDDTFSLVPQGGGHHATGHRCPGEWITIALMSEALKLLRRTRYLLPQQDLRIDFARLPALPRSRVIISNVEPPSRLSI